MDLDAIAAELYAGAPEDFTALRKQRASQARANGDRELARQVLALRRPTRSAWIVNLLADHAADDLAALFELGTALAQAQSRLSGEELRQLSAQRHAAIAALTRRGGQLAEVRGHTPAEATQREVSDTLQAALSDPGIAEQVRSGRLTKAQEYSGFGPETIFAAAPKPGAPQPAVDDDHDDASDDQDAGQEQLIEGLNTAQSALDGIRARIERAAERAGKAAETAAKRRDRVTELRDQLDRAERESTTAAAEQDRADAAVRDLRTAEQAAEDAVAAALSALADS